MHEPCTSSLGLALGFAGRAKTSSNADQPDLVMPSVEHSQAFAGGGWRRAVAAGSLRAVLVLLRRAAKRPQRSYPSACTKQQSTTAPSHQRPLCLTLAPERRIPCT